MSDTPAKPRGGLADLFVSRPIFGIVINLLILIAGLAALVAVDVREMPDVDQPVLSVRRPSRGVWGLVRLRSAISLAPMT
jgi:hypothetical protein